MIYLSVSDLNKSVADIGICVQNSVHECKKGDIMAGLKKLIFIDEIVLNIKNMYKKKKCVKVTILHT